MVKATVKIEKEVNAYALMVNAHVRHWEDYTVTGADELPKRDGDAWRPTILLDEGRIEDWPKGVTADIHFKVCDGGKYCVYDDNNELIVAREGYVPSILSPGGKGYGDYIIMAIDGDGVIEDFEPELICELFEVDD